MGTPFGTKILGQGFPDLTVTVDFTDASWNGSGNHQLLDVTGVVRCQMVAVVTEVFAGGSGTISLGNANHAGSLRATVARSQFTTITPIWGATTTSKSIQARLNSTDSPIDTIMDFVTTKNIRYALSDACTDGTMVFYVWWTALSSDGNVAEGDGS